MISKPNEDIHKPIEPTQDKPFVHAVGFISRVAISAQTDVVLRPQREMSNVGHRLQHLKADLSKFSRNLR